MHPEMLRQGQAVVTKNQVLVSETYMSHTGAYDVKMLPRKEVRGEKNRPSLSFAHYQSIESAGIRRCKPYLSVEETAVSTHESIRTAEISWRAMRWTEVTAKCTVHANGCLQERCMGCN